MVEFINVDGGNENSHYGDSEKKNLSEMDIKDVSVSNDLPRPTLTKYADLNQVRARETTVNFMPRPSELWNIAMSEKFEF